MSDVRPRAPAKVKIEPVVDLKYVVSSDDNTSSSSIHIGPALAGVFAARASAIPNLSSTALAYASCVQRIVPALTFR